MYVNFLKPTGYVIHNRFNMQQLYALNLMEAISLCDIIEVYIDIYLRLYTTIYHNSNYNFFI